MKKAFVWSPGITPAYAGNTKQWSNTAKVGRDHPRLRGEHRPHIHIICTGLGSPPPTRGTQATIKPNAVPSGITPAYAGNTSFSLLCAIFIWDHPRLRGEHVPFTISTHLVLGSPPPTRGTR